MIPVEIVGVRVEMPSNQPIVLVKESGGIRYLPIWVGAVEATAIAFALQNMNSIRPLTHELLLNTVTALNSKVKGVVLTELKDGIFYSELHLEEGIKISARPSDAIALALRSKVSISATEELFNQASIEIPDQGEDEVEKFKEFLDHVNPEDFLG